MSDVYNQVRFAPVSLQCAAAAEDYFILIAPLCSQYPDEAHSLLRLALRPVFYMGISDFKSMLAYIEDLNASRPDFLKWLVDHESLMDIVLRELAACVPLYDLRYEPEKNAVFLDSQAIPNDVGASAGWPDYDLGLEFRTFNDFRLFFYSIFDRNEVSLTELDRLISEENYYESHFFHLEAGREGT